MALHDHQPSEFPRWCRRLQRPGHAAAGAISAPTGLAIRLAQETGLTLAGFARKGQHNVYTHSFRLT
jgi:formate dehydrogenase assembly factor FdhD